MTDLMIRMMRVCIYTCAYQSLKGVNLNALLQLSALIITYSLSGH